MARPDGTVSFEAAGARHTLRFGINQLCDVEERLGVNVVDLGAQMAKGLSLRQLRTIFAAGLGESVTNEQAGDLIDEIGMQRAGDMVGEAMQAAFPAPSADASPQKAAAGTGSSS